MLPMYGDLHSVTISDYHLGDSSSTSHHFIPSFFVVTMWWLYVVSEENWSCVDTLRIHFPQCCCVSDTYVYYVSAANMFQSTVRFVSVKAAESAGGFVD